MLRSHLLSGVDHGFGLRDSNLTQDAMVSLKQIHSGIVLAAPAIAGCAGQGDALVARQPGPPISIRTADCLPILFADLRTGAVAAVHAGWRGTVARVAANAVERMRVEFGARPEDVLAAIGPGIGVCCYRVGAEVAREFGKAKAGNVDLAEVNRWQLQEAGLRAGNIEIIASCTYCDAERFWSYRREGELAGRMISFISPMQ